MKCEYCNTETDHPVTACPSVKSVAFDSEGNVVKVEKFEPQRPTTFSYGNTTSTPYKVTYTYWRDGNSGQQDKEEPH